MKNSALIITVALAACSAKSETTTVPVTDSDVRVALTDLGVNKYKGFTGGLYPEGSNTPPAAHRAEGLRRAALIQPIDGKIVFLSIGMSNGTQEFCMANGYAPCQSWSFMGKAAADPTINHTTLQLVNGARGGQVASSWTSPTSPEYDRIRDQALTPRGLSEQQVQVIWTKIANSNPTRSLPDARADAYVLKAQLDTIVHTFRKRYPNLQMVFFGTRIYAGFAVSTLNPEPYAYETGFAHKWAIEEQIRTGDYSGAWIAWGPYFWAGDVNHKRSDGLYYESADFENDGTHPSTSGEGKVADQMIQFFKTSEFTRGWFLAH